MKDTFWTKKNNIQKSKHKPDLRESKTPSLVGFFDDLFETKEGFESTSAPPTGTPAPPTGTPAPPTGTPAPSTGTPAPPTGTPAPPTATPSNSIDTKLDAKLSQTGQRIGDAFKNAKNTLGSDINSLKSDISNILSDVEQLDSIGDAFDSLGGALDVKMNVTQQLKYLNIGNITSDAGNSGKQLMKTIGITIQKLASYVILFKKMVELFILELNDNINTLITKMANALTQNTATTKEITIFKDQTQKILFITTIWMLVYNWYYVMFYLDSGDGIRYTFNVDSIMYYSKWVYAVIGPSMRVVEIFNWLLITGEYSPVSLLKKYVPTSMIYVIMFIIFTVLVAADFQSMLFIDFFNALQHKFGLSIMYIFTTAVVAYYALNFFFIQSGIVQNLLGWSWLVGAIAIIIALFLYVNLVVSVTIPFGMIFIFAYLVMNSFFGVIYYEGSNALNIYSGISESIIPIAPDLSEGNICVESPEWYLQWKLWPTYIWRFLKKSVNYLAAYMFEIMILLTLLGGIGVYSKNFQSALEGKVGISAYNPSSVKQAFKQLFTWLILINIVIIVLLIMFAVKKYRAIQALIPNGAAGMETVPISKIETALDGIPEPLPVIVAQKPVEVAAGGAQKPLEINQNKTSAFSAGGAGGAQKPLAINQNKTSAFSAGGAGGSPLSAVEKPGFNSP